MYSIEDVKTYNSTENKILVLKGIDIDFIILSTTNNPNKTKTTSTFENMYSIEDVKTYNSTENKILVLKGIDIDFIILSTTNNPNKTKTTSTKNSKTL